MKTLSLLFLFILTTGAIDSSALGTPPCALLLPGINELRINEPTTRWTWENKRAELRSKQGGLQLRILLMESQGPTQQRLVPLHRFSVREDLQWRTTIHNINSTNGFWIDGGKFFVFESRVIDIDDGTIKFQSLSPDVRIIRAWPGSIVLFNKSLLFMYDLNSNHAVRFPIKRTEYLFSKLHFGALSAVSENDMVSLLEKGQSDFSPALHEFRSLVSQQTKRVLMAPPSESKKEGKDDGLQTGSVTFDSTNQSLQYNAGGFTFHFQRDARGKFRSQAQGIQ